MLEKWLFKRIDNSALIIFRVIFGFLILAQSWGSILTGYVSEKIIPAKFTFNFIGLDFIQPPPGNWAYVFFIVMGVFAIGVMIGYKYKWSMTLFTLFWAWFYFMQKANYNNHYYLLLLLCFFMIFVPANRYFAVDTKGHPDRTRIHMPNWVRLFVLLQMGIVYTYAAIAKIYPDWLDGTVAIALANSKANLPLIGGFLQKNWALWSIAYFGILFDLLIVPLMLWKKTRKWAFISAIFFHLFNSAVFQIGIFPYLALALFLFFFPTSTVHRYFLRKKPFYDNGEIVIPSYKNWAISALSLWFIIQLLLPIRHWCIPGDVLWTDEGHRLSWRMMLRHRSGFSSFRIVNKTTGEEFYVDKKDYLTPSQMGATSTNADMIWQFAQHLKKEYAQKGEEIAVYVKAQVGVNGKPSQPFIDPGVDMAQVKWNYFGHNTWILPPESNSR